MCSHDYLLTKTSWQHCEARLVDTQYIIYTLAFTVIRGNLNNDFMQCNYKTGICYINCAIQIVLVLLTFYFGYSCSIKLAI